MKEPHERRLIEEGSCLVGFCMCLVRTTQDIEVPFYKVTATAKAYTDIALQCNATPLLSLHHNFLLILKRGESFV